MNLPGNCTIGRIDRMDTDLKIVFDEERMVVVRGREWIGAGEQVVVLRPEKRNDNPIIDADLGDVSDLLDDRDWRELREWCERMDEADREAWAESPEGRKMQLRYRMGYVVNE